MILDLDEMTDTTDTNPTTSKPASVRALARHLGITHQAVRKAIAAGRLRASVITVNGRPKLRDLEAAAAEWRATSDQAPAAPAERLKSARATLRAAIREVSAAIRDLDGTSPAA